MDKTDKPATPQAHDALTSAALGVVMGSLVGAARAARGVQVFYTAKDRSGIKVSLWASPLATPGGPAVDGTIGVRRVDGHLRTGSKGNFLSIVERRRLEGQSSVLGSAKVVVNSHAIKKLAIRLDGHAGTIWAEVSRQADTKLLQAAGLDLQDLTEKQEKHQAKTEAKANEAKLRN